MDHTLAPYIRESFEALAFYETVNKFVEAGYPEELRELKFNPTFLIRGLLVDKEKGNILKADSHKYVKVAYHGHIQLDKSHRHSLYNSQSIKLGDFLSVDTFFALSEVQLFVEIVDFMDRHPGSIKKTYEEVYADLRRFIDLCHRDGSIKDKVMAHPEVYIRKDKHLAKSLVRLIDAGKKIFLLTNSLYDYTNQIMSFILDGSHEDFSSWKDFFQYIIVGAGKPGFFIGSQPFLEVVEESNLLKIHDGVLRHGSVYHGGNAFLLEQLTNHRGDEILYVGDHIYGDIIRSKGSLNWRTLLIVEELDEEIPKVEVAKKVLDQTYGFIAEKELIDESIQKMRSKMGIMERQVEIAAQRNDAKKVENIKAEIVKTKLSLEEAKEQLNRIEVQIRDNLLRRDREFHPVWGELMKVGFERSRFAQQVGVYACLYTSKASNLRFYSPFKKFISFHETLPHDV